MNDISYRLKILMDGMSVRKFADRLGVRPTTLQEYLKGRIPPADFIVRVCERMHVDANWFLTGKGEQNPLYECRVSEGATDFKIEGKNNGRDIFVSSNSSSDNVAIIIDEMHRAMIDLMDSVPTEKNELVALVKGYLMGKKGK